MRKIYYFMRKVGAKENFEVLWARENVEKTFFDIKLKIFFAFV